MWFNADKLKKNFKQFEKDLPPVLANQAVRFFVGNFEAQGFRDDPTKQWEQVKRRIPGTSEYKYPKKRGLSRRTKPIGIMTGRLRRDTNNSKQEVSMKLIRLRIKNPYATYFQFGTDHSPARPIMGNSKKLRSMQIQVMKKMMRKNFGR